LCFAQKYFPADFWLFLYIYQFCYISGPPIQEEMYLASKLMILGENKKNYGQISFDGRETKLQAARAFKLLKK
jgi:hypothetical protein